MPTGHARPVLSAKQSPNAKQTGLKNARALSAAQSALTRLTSLAPNLTGGQCQSLSDIGDNLKSSASQVVRDEISNMTVAEIISAAGSIKYYARKFSL